MKHISICAVAVLLALSGCASETASFQPGLGQEALVRDGQPALISRKATSVVMIRPASREFQSGARPAFTVAVINAGAERVDFRVSQISATQQVAGGQPQALKVFSYEELVREEKQRQLAQAIFVGLAAGANSAAASNAGYYRAQGTVSSPYGTSHVMVTGYDPTAASIAQARASAANARMIDDAIDSGQRNMAALEQTIIKDNTILPGEIYGGRLIIDAPKARSQGEAKIYTLVIEIGGERHEISISQSAATG